MRSYGQTNAAPYASAPAIGAAGDTYFNTTSKTMFVSDGAVWAAIAGPPTGTAGGGLSGTYPNPTCLSASGTFSVTSTCYLTGQLNAYGNIVVKPQTAAVSPTVAFDCNPGIGLTPAAGAVIGQVINYVGGPLAAVTQFYATEQWVVGSAMGVGYKLMLNQPGVTSTLQERMRFDQNGWALRSPAGVQQLSLDTAGTLTAAGNVYGQGVFRGLNPIIPAQWSSFTSVQAQANYQAGSLYQGGMLSFYAQEAWTASARGTSCQITTTPAGTSTMSSSFTFDHQGNIVISGPVGQKSTGTTWSNPSDRRIKDEITDYPTGLAIVAQLQPRTFVYNGKGGSQAGMRGFGFIADEVQAVMPEMVSTTSAKLDANDAELTDIQIVDQSNLILALVNAVKELKEEINELRAATQP